MQSVMLLIFYLLIFLGIQPDIVLMLNEAVHNETSSTMAINRFPMIEKRSIPQFGGIVTLYTRTSPLRLIYYGNWCGSGGMGPTLDDIDRCCMEHDLCYGRVEKEPCGLSLFQKPYNVIYSWRWSDQQKQAYCLTTGDGCADATCQCDRVAARCFSRFMIDAKLEGNRLRKHRHHQHLQPGLQHHLKG